MTTKCEGFSNPSGFAFIEFEDPRDAADTGRELDRRTLYGCPGRVELWNGVKRSRSHGPSPCGGHCPGDDSAFTSIKQQLLSLLFKYII